MSESRPIDLQEFVSVMKLGLDNRNDASFDWGFVDAFKEAIDGERFDDVGEWIAVPGSMVRLIINGSIHLL